MALIEKNFTADGDSGVIDWNPNFSGHFMCEGTFGSGTATLKYSLDGGATYIAADSTDLAFTVDGASNFVLPECKLKVTLSGSTSPNLNCYVVRGHVL